MIDVLTIAKVMARFCNSYLVQEAPVYILEETMNGKTVTEEQAEFLAGFIEHLQKCWNNKVKKLEENR